MKRFFFILIIFAVIIIGLGAGTGARYLAERSGVFGGKFLEETPSHESAPANNPGEKESSGGLCIDFLHIQTDLPTPRFSFEVNGTLGVVKRDGQESFLIYPLVEGLNLEKEYKVSEHESFLTEKAQKPVYKFTDNEQISYLIPNQLPFFLILLKGSPNDQQSKKDAEMFLNTMRSGPCSLK